MLIMESNEYGLDPVIFRDNYLSYLREITD